MGNLKFTPELAHDWKNALSDTQSYIHRRVLDSMNASQLESKLWLIQELRYIHQPISVAILAGWFSQYSVPLLFDNFGSIKWIENFEIDRDVKKISYKFNKRYKNNNTYKCETLNVMFDPIWKKQRKTDILFDTIINTSCEHMFPMWKFKDINKSLAAPEVKNYLYVLQSSNDDRYDDHINCVVDEDELIDQARLIDVLYSGKKRLSNGMTRFMVIGR